jgi:hypothetical protein
MIVILRALLEATVKKLRILMRMLRNRLLSSNPVLRSAHTSGVERIVFVLNFFPPYNLVCWLWIKFCIGTVRGRASANGISWWLMRRGFLFGALRQLSPEDRLAFANAIVRPELARSCPAASADPAALALAGTLERTGYVKLGPMMSESDARSGVDYFSGQQGYASQTPLQSDGILRAYDPQLLRNNGQDRYFCFSSRTSLACPQIKALLAGGRLRSIAAAYLGFMPEMYSINTIVTDRGDEPHYVMNMHRDQDAFACVTFFVCWTAVSEKNGATIYLPRSHVSSSVEASKLDYLEGGPGEVFCVDTFGLHKGNSDVTGPRFATWIRYGSAPNLGTIQDPDLVPEPLLS